MFILQPSLLHTSKDSQFHFRVRKPRSFQNMGRYLSLCLDQFIVYWRAGNETLQKLETFFTSIWYSLVWSAEIGTFWPKRLHDAEDYVYRSLSNFQSGILSSEAAGSNLVPLKGAALCQLVHLCWWRTARILQSNYKENSLHEVVETIYSIP